MRLRVSRPPHECPVDGCTASVRAGFLMCASCWSTVPGSIRRQVNRTWREFKARDRSHPDAALMLIGTYREVRDAAVAAAKPMEVV